MPGCTVVRTDKFGEITYPVLSAAPTVTARCRDFLRLPPEASLVWGWSAERLRFREINIGHIIKLGDSIYLLCPIRWLLRLLWCRHLWCGGVGDVGGCAARGFSIIPGEEKKEEGYRDRLLDGKMRPRRGQMRSPRREDEFKTGGNEN